MRALITGWFSFEQGEATAGDLRAAEVVCGWLDEADIAYDVATSPAFGGGLDWREVDPGDYSDVVFVCGPLHGEQLDALVDRFRGCRRTAVDVSLTPGAPPDFDVVFERDGGGAPRPDLAIASARESAPVVGVVRAHAQPEYGGATALDEVHATIDRALAGERVAIVELDTRVDPREPGIQTCAQVESAIARTDAVVTTRLHGLVMALKGGTPALAIDPVHGGGKVTGQARALEWPHVRGVDALEVEDLRAALRSCLDPDARRTAAECRDRVQEQVRRLGETVVQSLAESHRVA